MGMTKAERQARQEKIDKDREAIAAERRKRDHERFITNHLPGTTLMFAAKRTRDSFGRRLPWQQHEHLMWSRDYNETKKFVDDEIRKLGPSKRHYMPIEIERIFLTQIAGKWHRVYANRFSLGGNLKMDALTPPPRIPMSYDDDELVNVRIGCICPPNDEHGGLCHKDCPIHGVQAWQAPPPPLEPPTLENGGVMCKGSLMLGTACLKCVRCKEELAKTNSQLKAV